MSASGNYVKQQIQRKFTEAEEAVVYASGTRCTVPVQAGRVFRPIGFKLDKWDADKEWVKSRTPHRLNMKMVKTRSGRKARLLKDKKSYSKDLYQVQPELASVHARTCDALRREPVQDFHQAATVEVMEESPMVPLPTLIVKWQLKYDRPAFTLREVRCLMSKFGKVEILCCRSPNSAVVVYGNLTSAQLATASKSLGAPFPVIMTCQWLYPTLAQSNILGALKDKLERITFKVQALER